MATIHVEVTQEDIERGIREDGANCPIAHAFRRVWKGNNDFVVEHWEIEFDDGFTEDIPLPHVARQNISWFDEGISIHPFSFDLEIPDEVL